MKTGSADDVDLTASRESVPQVQSVAAAAVRAAKPAVAAEVEQLVDSVWREVLRVERLRPEDNFFERGGSSLLAVKVTARILDALGIELALREIFRHPTLAQFTEVVISRRLKAMEAALLGSDGEDRQLLERVRNMSTAEVADLNQTLKKGR